MEIAIIGAGSHFTLALLRSLYQQSLHDNYHIRLMDVRPEPLEALADLIPRLNKVSGRSISFSCHRERITALEGADHVLASFAVDFPASFLRTCWIMRNHGIQFVEGETATPGALMATLRHLPPLIALTEEIQYYAPEAWLHIINNPMPRLVLGVIRGTGFNRLAGHCHGTLAVREQLASLTQTPAAEVELFVAGINHFHLVQRAVDRRNGEDLLQALKNLPPDEIATWQRHDFTQWRMFEELGYFIGHGIWHNFDYLPYANERMFRHSDYNTWERACLATQSERRFGAEIGSDLQTDDTLADFLALPETEQMFSVMQALSGEIPSYSFLSGNMPNGGHIPNLPDGAVVELPANVSADGIELRPSPEPLPSFFAAWLTQQIAIHDLSVAAVLEHSRQAAVEAIVTDPAFRDCNCSPGQLLNEMLDVNRGIVPRLC